MSRHKKMVSIGLHTLLTVLAIIWLVPVFWLLLSSFRAEKGAYTYFGLRSLLLTIIYVYLLTPDYLIFQDGS